MKAATAGLVSLSKNKIFSLYDTLTNTDPNRTVAEILADPANWADPVHLARIHYAAMAGALLVIKADTDAEASPPKRPRLESVVTAQQPPKRGAKRIPLPGWVLGKGSSARGGMRGGGGNDSTSWRGRGGGMYGGWPRGRAGSSGSWGFERGGGRGRNRGRGRFSR